MKNKILTTGIILIILSFVFISNVSFGATYDLNDYKNHIPGENFRWVIVRSLQDNNIYLLVSSVEWREFFTGVATFDGVECSDGKFYTYGNKQFGYYTFNEETSVFDNYNVAPTSSVSSSYYVLQLGYCEMIAAGFEVYYDGQKGNVFFQKTPLPSKVIIGQMTEQEKMEEIMKTATEQATTEVTQVILIVIATTAGLMVLLIGFRKGLIQLVSGLRT